METAAVLDVATQALVLAAKLAAPVLVTSLVVGLTRRESSDDVRVSLHVSPRALVLRGSF